MVDTIAMERSMQLPGRLRSTTLGDLLGTLSRGAATGTLELVEDGGRRHRVSLAGGAVVAVELHGATPSLAEVLRAEHLADEDTLRRSLLRALSSARLHGEVLIHDFDFAPHVVGNALRRQLLLRLGVLERLADARILFRVAVRPPRGALVGDAAGDDRAAAPRWNGPLFARDFLPGRRRARPRSGGPTPRGDASSFRLLGLSPGAELSEIKRAYRRLARSVHPDAHPDATPDQQRALSVRFTELTAAYRSLV